MGTASADSVQDLIDALGRLPGIGPKSAQRIAFHLLKVDAEEANRLARAIVDAKERVGFCARCFNLAEGDRVPLALTFESGAQIALEVPVRADAPAGEPAHAAH